MIHIVCPNCQRPLAVPITFAGHIATCQLCRQPFTVPGVQPPAAPVLTPPVFPAGAVPHATPNAASPFAIEPEKDDDDDDRPIRRKRPAPPRSPAKLALYILGGVTLAGLLFMGVSWVVMMRWAKQGADDPLVLSFPNGKSGSGAFLPKATPPAPPSPAPSGSVRVGDSCTYASVGDPDNTIQLITRYSVTKVDGDNITVRYTNVTDGKESGDESVFQRAKLRGPEQFLFSPKGKIPGNTEKQTGNKKNVPLSLKDEIGAVETAARNDPWLKRNSKLNALPVQFSTQKVDWDIRQTFDGGLQLRVSESYWYSDDVPLFGMVLHRKELAAQASTNRTMIVLVDYARGR